MNRRVNFCMSDAKQAGERCRKGRMRQGDGRNEQKARPCEKAGRHEAGLFCLSVSAIKGRGGLLE